MATLKGLSARIVDDEQAPPWRAEGSPAPLRYRGALPGVRERTAEGTGWDPGRAPEGSGTSPAGAPPTAPRGSSRPARSGPRPELYLALPGEEGTGSSGRAPGGTRGGRGGAGVSMAIASRSGGAATTRAPLRPVREASPLLPPRCARPAARARTSSADECAR